MPTKTMDRACARRSTGAIEMAIPAMSAVAAEPQPISTRAASRVVRSCASAVTKLPSANSDSAVTSATRGASPAVATRKAGASSAVASEYTVVACPTAPTPTPKVCAMGTSNPAFINAAVPMTRLTRPKR